ncbi:hypothetical protein MAR_028305, partial [Mya arenaria]
EHQNQLFKVVTSIERVVCRTTSEEGQEIDNHSHDQSHTREQIVVLKGEVRQLSEERDQLSGDSETNKARIEELQTKVTVKNEKIKEIKKEKSTAKKQEELDLAKKEIEQLRKAIKREDDEKEKKTVELDETSLEITSLDPQPEQSS